MFYDLSYRFLMRVFASREELMRDAAIWVVGNVDWIRRWTRRHGDAEAARQAWEARRAWGHGLEEAVWVALAGGETPQPAYELLGKHDAPVLRQAVFVPTDERCVPEDDARSNAGMLRRTLGGGLHVAPLREGAKMDAAIPDMVLLGAGADGHVASVFGDAPAGVWEADEVVRLHPAGQPEARLSMPPSALAAAPEMLLLICGAEKFALLGRGLRKNGDENLPITRLLAARGKRGNSTWVYYAE